ncbi:MATE family efflux transporter [Youxingia wuxianensis]|uniref:MATE family efflux transporter n=1 Tax=Youxingia wuxianensis TaxID=2763678 RepID=UPI0021CC8966|nr:MATE family efflux transporter [Youxingia wuxianensis]
MKLQKDLTTGSVRAHLIRFTIPLIISNIFQVLYNAVDMFFVGKYAGTESLSAVSVCGPIMDVLIISISGLSVGVSVAIANYAGNHQTQDVKDCANSAIGLYAVIAVVFTVIGFILSPQILALVQTPQEAMPHAIQYLRTIFCGIVFMLGYNLINALQRGFGDSNSSMIFIIVSAGVNIVLDFIFVCLLDMHAFGAALATVIAQAVSFVMGVVYFRIQKHVVTFRLKDIRFHVNQLRFILRIGLPTALNEVLVNLAYLTVSGVANSFGLAASAAYGIGMKIDNIAIFSDSAMNMTMSSFASQNIGAGKPQRALDGLKEALKLSGILGLITAVIVFFFAPGFAAIFNSDPLVIGHTVDYLHISLYSYVLFALVGPLIGFIRGTGNLKTSVIVGFIAQYVFRVPCAFLFCHFIGFPGVAVAILVGPLSSTIMYGWIVATGRWKRGLKNLNVSAQGA